MEPSTLDHSAYILIAIGAFIFIISFLGYFGSLQENKVLLTAYGLFLLIIFGLQVPTRLISFKCFIFLIPGNRDSLDSGVQEASGSTWTGTAQEKPINFLYFQELQEHSHLVLGPGHVQHGVLWGEQLHRLSRGQEVCGNI